MTRALTNHHCMDVTMYVPRVRVYPFRRFAGSLSSRPALLSTIVACGGTPILDRWIEVSVLRLNGNGFYIEPR